MDKSVDRSGDEEGGNNFLVSVIDTSPSQGRLSNACSSALDESTSLFGIDSEQFDLLGSRLIKLKSCADECSEFEEQIQKLMKKKEKFDCSLR